MKESKTINKEKFEAFIDGTEEGLKFYFDTYYRLLCLYAKRFLNKADTTEDIVSECFFRVWNKHEIFHDEQHLISYLYKSVYNQCLKAKRDRVSEGLTEDNEAVAPDYFNEIIRNETLRQLYQSIDTLPTQCKEVFTQLYVEGKTVRETADEMGLHISTVKAQKARGLSILRARLGDLEMVLFLLAVSVS